MRGPIKIGCMALVLSVSLATPVAANPFDDGLDACTRDDYATALGLFRPLAEQDLASAQSMLGRMYCFGQGVSQDYAAAVTWYRKAAEQGLVSAQSNLDRMYAEGRGVPQDYVQAHMWFTLAATRFPASEAERREDAVTNRSRIAAKMTAAQIAEAQRLAREWKPK